MSDKTDIVIELNQEWRASHTPDARFLTVHVAEWIRCTDLTRRAAEEIKRLRQERDEARRDVCDMMHITGFLAGDYAASRGWDCFPDRKRNVSEEVKNFRAIMERDYNAVVAQRDEARREAMLLLSERSSEKEMREEYRKRGWSYLLSKEKQ
jgi:hypothetical protein